MKRPKPYSVRRSIFQSRRWRARSASYRTAIWIGGQPEACAKHPVGATNRSALTRATAVANTRHPNLRVARRSASVTISIIGSSGDCERPSQFVGRLVLVLEFHGGRIAAADDDGNAFSGHRFI